MNYKTTVYTDIRICYYNSDNRALTQCNTISKVIKIKKELCWIQIGMPKAFQTWIKLAIFVYVNCFVYNMKSFFLIAQFCNILGERQCKTCG